MNIQDVHVFLFIWKEIKVFEENRIFLHIVDFNAIA